MITTLSGYVKTGCRIAVDVLGNNKEIVKNISGVATFAFGFLGAYELCKIVAKRSPMSTEMNLHGTSIKEKCQRWNIGIGKFSLVCSAAVSRPGIASISFLASKLFTAAQLERAFGPNTIYAVNPLHPRHVCSNVTTLISIPLVLESTYYGARWVYHKMVSKDTPPLWISGGQMYQPKSTFSDKTLRWMVVFNFFTSRPVLHYGNIAMRSLLKM